jgi:hypothetical protein
MHGKPNHASAVRLFTSPFNNKNWDSGRHAARCHARRPAGPQREAVLLFGRSVDRRRRNDARQLRRRNLAALKYSIFNKNVRDDFVLRLP